MKVNLVALSAAVLISVSPAAAQQNLQSYEFRNVCGGTTFVFCASVFLEQGRGGFYGFELGMINESGGALGGYRGAVITEVRFEGVDDSGRPFRGDSHMEGNSAFHPGPLHTDFEDGAVVPAIDNFGFAAAYTSNPLLGIMSFRQSIFGRESPPWSLDLGLASSCGEDLFDPAARLFVSATCGFGSDGLIRTSEFSPYDEGPYSPWMRSFVEDWDGHIWNSRSEERVPTYDFRSAGLTIVAQDVADPDRVSVCRLGSTSCAIVTPEPSTAMILLGGLVGLAWAARRRQRG